MACRSSVTCRAGGQALEREGGPEAIDHRLVRERQCLWQCCGTMPVRSAARSAWPPDKEFGGWRDCHSWLHAQSARRASSPNAAMESATHPIEGGAGQRGRQVRRQRMSVQALCVDCQPAVQHAHGVALHGGAGAQGRGWPRGWGQGEQIGAAGRASHGQHPAACLPTHSSTGGSRAFKRQCPLSPAQAALLACQRTLSTAPTDRSAPGSTGRAGGSACCVPGAGTSLRAESCSSAAASASTASCRSSISSWNAAWDCGQGDMVGAGSGVCRLGRNHGLKAAGVRARQGVRGVRGGGWVGGGVRAAGGATAASVACGGGARSDVHGPSPPLCRACASDWPSSSCCATVRAARCSSDPSRAGRSWPRFCARNLVRPAGGGNMHASEQRRCHAASATDGSFQALQGLQEVLPHQCVWASRPMHAALHGATHRPRAA